MDIIRVNQVNKAFKDHVIFHDFSYLFESSKFYAIVGESGCGKSTLLNMIGLLESVDKGSIELFNKKITSIHQRDVRVLLRDKIGFLFQSYALMDDASVEKNLLVPLDLLKIKDSKERVHLALKRVGLEGFEKKLVNSLSGGEQQRIALARLILKPCDIILADEPTGNLDEKNKEMVFSILKELQTSGKTILMVTHDRELASRCDVVINLDKSE